MSVRVDDRRVRYNAFVLLMLAINLIDGLLVRSNAHTARGTLVAFGASLDVVVIVAALYYWMLVRSGIRAPGSLVAIVSIGVLHATYFFPNLGSIKAIVAGACETALIGFVIVQVRRRSRREKTADPVEAIGSALETVFMSSGLARLITGELVILYYGLFSWRAKPHVEEGTRAFSIHQRVGQADLFGIFPLLCALEMAPVHLVLQRWSPMAAWIATGVSVYSMIWLVGLARAFRLRPVLIGEDYLHLRYGLLWHLRVPKEMIASVRRPVASDGPCAWPRRSEPTVCIELAQLMEAEGLFGIRKRVERIAVTPDDGPAFEQALAELMCPPRSRN